MSHVVTVILDDDPTGTQSATDVDVLLYWNPDVFADAIARASSVYVLTNTRAVDEAAAVELIETIRRESAEIAERRGLRLRYVLRGDSTLRGHVFAESAVLMSEESVLVFVPAFPDGGRTTENGVHYVSVEGERIRADESEFAQDPVFPFDTADLSEYVTKYGNREPHWFPLPLIDQGADAVADALCSLPPGCVALFDAVTNTHIRGIAAGIRQAQQRGRDIVVRSASPLAAALAGVESRGLLGTIDRTTNPRRTLIACGSHTRASGEQLRAIEPLVGPALEIDTDRAFADPHAEGQRVAQLAAEPLNRTGTAVIATARHRRPQDGTLAHGQRVMTALTRAVASLADDVDTVVAKGGITSADVARVGLGATTARVLGQILPGISLWRIRRPSGTDITYVVVPGNVGHRDTLHDVLDRIGAAREAAPDV